MKREYTSLELQVISCEELRAFNFFQKLSVFVTVSIVAGDGRKKQLHPALQLCHRTPTTKGGHRNPEWNHEVEFDLSAILPRDYPDLRLKFDVRLPSVVGSRSIGEVRSSLQELVDEFNGTVQFRRYVVNNDAGKGIGVLNFRYKLCEKSDKVDNELARVKPSSRALVPGTPQPVEELEICSHDIEPGPPEYGNRKVLMRGGLGLMEPPEVTQWQTYMEIYLMENQLTELPEDPRCPVLLVLFLNRNYKLRTISPSFFNYMPALEILNLSRTRIKSLPESLFRLSSLKRLFLNHCELLMVLPPEIGELQQLEVLDLEGTEIMDLPKEVAKLTKLTCLEVSFCRRINQGTKSARVNALIPQGTISALSQLKELSIDVNPEDEKWESVVKDIVKDVCGLISLDTLKLYLPRVEHLRKFKWFRTSNVSRPLSHFKFIVGSHDECIMSRLPVDLEFEIEHWDRSLKYVNGVGVPKDIQNLLQQTTAFFLDRHMDVAKLSDFGIENMEQLKCCIIGECNEIKFIVDGLDVYDEADRSEVVLETGEDDRRFLKSLEYLYVYRMKSLSCIYEGPLHRGSLSHLKCLVLVTCPRLTTVFTPDLLKNLDSLEELKVEDCPLVLSLMTCEDTSIYESTHFLPNLKRISLFSLLELISISNGLRIAPNLERMSIFDCPNLKSPSTDEICCNHPTLTNAKLERICISDCPNPKSPSTDGVCCNHLTWTKANLERTNISDSPNLKSPSTD